MGEKQATAEARSAGEVAAIQARKDLTAMGFKYFDNGQFLETVKRGDVLTARLFLVGAAWIRRRKPCSGTPHSTSRSAKATPR